MTKYSGKIEAKEEKKTKTNTQYFCFAIDGKKWNCFDAIVNQEFKIGDCVEFETEQKWCCKNPQPSNNDSICSTCGNEFKKFENLIPETMKKIDVLVPVPIIREAKTWNDNQVSIQKTIHENPDSLEIGTPSKGGAIKIYGDFNDMAAFLEKVFKAKQVRDEANKLLSTD